MKYLHSWCISCVAVTSSCTLSLHEIYTVSIMRSIAMEVQKAYACMYPEKG